MKKRANIGKNLRSYKNNLDRIKLVTLNSSFKERVKQLRSKYMLESPYYARIYEWPDSLGKLRLRRSIFESLKSDESVLQDAENIAEQLTEDINALRKDFELPRHFNPHIMQYALDGTINAPAVNWELLFEGHDSGKLLMSEVVSIRIFKRLLTDEKRILFKLLEGFQNDLPSTHQKAKQFRDLEKYLEIYQAALTRELPHTVTVEGSYVDLSRKTNKNMGEKELRRLKREHPQSSEKIEGMTSKDIAQEKLGSSKRHASVRQTASRVKKELEK